MAVGATGLRGMLVTAHPCLANTVQTMRTTSGGVGHGGVADSALADCSGIALGLDGLQVVIHLIIAGAGDIGELGVS